MTSVSVPGWRPLLLATASIGIANSVVFAVLSDLQDEIGFGDVGLGMVAGTGFVVALIGQLLLAPFADRGHAKRLLLTGLALAVIGSVAFAFSTSLVMLVASRAVVGLSNSLFLPAARAIAASIDSEQVARRLGTLSGVELAGFVTGPVVGGALVDPFGLRVPFLVAGSVALVGLVLLAPRALPQPPIGAARGLAIDLLRIPRLRAGVLISIAMFVPVGFYDATLDRFLTDLGASNTTVGLAFLAFGVPFAVFAAAGGRIADRYGAMRVALVSTLLVLPITVTYGFVTVPGVIVLLSGVEGVVQALGVPAAQAVVARAAPIGRVAAAQGLAGAGSMLVGAVTAYAAGGLYEALGPAGMFIVAGVGIAVFVGLAVLQRGEGAGARSAPTPSVTPAER